MAAESIAFGRDVHVFFGGGGSAMDATPDGTLTEGATADDFGSALASGSDRSAPRPFEGLAGWPRRRIGRPRRV